MSFFGTRGGKSKFLVCSNNINYRNIKFFIKRSYIAFFYYIIAILRLYKVVSYFNVSVTDEVQSYINEMENKGYRFLFLCYGSDHCFGKDTFVFRDSSSKKTFISQHPRSHISEKNLVRFFNNMHSINFHRVDFDIPDYSLIESTNGIYLVSSNDDEYIRKENYNILDIIDISSKISNVSKNKKVKISYFLNEGKSVIVDVLKKERGLYFVNEAVDELSEFISDQKLTENIELFLSHGDFTPWNIMKNEHSEKYLVIDWEWVGYRVANYDIYHYLVNLDNISSNKFNSKITLTRISKMMLDLSCNEHLSKDLDKTGLCLYLFSIIVFFSRSSILDSDSYGASDLTVLNNYSKLARDLVK